MEYSAIHHSNVNKNNQRNFEPTCMWGEKIFAISKILHHNHNKVCIRNVLYKLHAYIHGGSYPPVSILVVMSLYLILVNISVSQAEEPRTITIQKFIDSKVDHLCNV